MSPKAFTDCVNSGGKVVTKKLKGDRYIHICYGKDGKSHTGEIKTKKKEKSVEQVAKEKIEQSRVLIEDLRRLKEHFDENHRNG